MRQFCLLLLLFLLITSCEQQKDNLNRGTENEPPKKSTNKKPDPKADYDVETKEKKSDVPVAEAKKEAAGNMEDFREITTEQGILLDIKYATKDNFTKKVIYPCGRCYLRPDVAQKIEAAHQWLQNEHKKGLKMFDCYRPRPAQQRLWDVVPNPDYVTPPAKGSMHNRGLAVDLTLVDQNGKELNMGTPYDFFGKEAHTDNTNLPAAVLENRRLLKQAMTAQGFSGIRTEWWHFSINDSAPLSDWEWPCK
jgi:D-alanyl-D-alanine dipeptidase